MRFWGLIQRRLLTLLPTRTSLYARAGPEMEGTARSSPVRRPRQGAKRGGGSRGPQPTTVTSASRTETSDREHKRSEGRVSHPRLPVK